MKHVGAAILLAQAVVRRARVEDQRFLGPRRVRDRKKLVRGQISDDVPDARGEHVVERRDRIVAGPELCVDDRKGLIEELSGGVVVRHRHARAGDEIVRGRNVKNGDCLAAMRLAQDADRDFERICPCQRERCEHGEDSNAKDAQAPWRAPQDHQRRDQDA